MQRMKEKVLNELGLSQNYSDREHLDRLIVWCQEHIAQDLQFSGTDQEKYIGYLALVEQFCSFLEHAGDDVQTLYNAASQGYDRFILNNHLISTERYHEPGKARCSPLHVAAEFGYVHVVDALLLRGADPTQVNQAQQLPVQRALFLPINHNQVLVDNKIRIVKRLLNASPEALFHQDKYGEGIFHHLVVHVEFFELMQLILAENTSNQRALFLQSYLLGSPIHLAVKNNYCEVADYLLSFDGIAQIADMKGRLPIHVAAQYGQAEMLEICCKNTSDLNVRDAESKTGWMLAVEHGNIIALNALLMHQADPTLNDALDRNLLHYAVLSRRPEVIAWIIKHISCIDSQHHDIYGRTPLDYCNHAPELEAPFLQARQVSRP